MLASKLIEELQKHIDKYGDLEVAQQYYSRILQPVESIRFAAYKETGEMVFQLVPYVLPVAG